MKKYFIEIVEFNVGVDNRDFAKLKDYAFPLKTEALEVLSLSPIGTQFHISFNDGEGAFILETVFPPIIEINDDGDVEIQINCSLSVV